MSPIYVHNRSSRHRSVLPGVALKRYGGKVKLRSLLLGIFPPHEVYVEPFAGAAPTLLSKAPASVEVLNDLDADWIALLRAIKDPADCQALQSLLLATPNSREHYEACRQAFPTCTDRME